MAQPVERAHARISPSALARIIKCPGSVNFIEEMGFEDESGTAADEGTILHSFAEDCLVKGLEPHDLVGEEREYNGYRYEMTEADADGILEGLDILDDIPGKMLVETRVDLGRWLPGQFGTSDVAIIQKLKSSTALPKTIWVTVFDWKFGFNAVSPVENPQLMAYALGIWDNHAQHMIPEEHWHLVKIKLIICQPRAPGGGGEWVLSLDDLLTFGKMLKKLGKTVADPKAPRIAGSWCDKGYCPGAKTLKCPEYDRFNLEMFKDDPDDLDDEDEIGAPLRVKTKMTPERRSHIVKHKAVLLKWLERLHAQTVADAEAGKPTPGLKLVMGRAPAKRWVDKDDAAQQLELLADDDVIYTKRLITPTQAEKTLPPKAFARIKRAIVIPDKKPVLVDEMDARPAIKDIKEEFVDDDEE